MGKCKKNKTLVVFFNNLINIRIRKTQKLILMKKHNRLWLLLCISFFISCNPDPITKPVLLSEVTTTEVKYVTQYTATCGGVVTSLGKSDGIMYGVCWSTNPHPTIADNKSGHDYMNLVNSTNPIDFTIQIENLTGGTTYYIRAYAKNVNKVNIDANSIGFISVGETVYGNDYKFTTDVTTPTVTDADGNIYHTIKIGTQLWMLENLRTTKYNDGTKIPTVKIIYGNEFSKLQTPAYCWYNSDSITFKNIFGALYNGYAVSTGKLAPIGWHVPTIDDWKKLSNFLGGDSISGGKLKSTKTSSIANHESFVHEGNWLSPNTGATNSSGFSALASGNVASSYGFGNGGSHCFWWSSTEDNIILANSHFTIGLGYSTKNILTLPNGADNTFGFSVRCIRD